MNRRRLLATLALAVGLVVGFVWPAMASRNSAGAYSLPAGNPVVSGTTINTNWANTTLGDISTELTDSLDRSGKGGMLAPMRTTDGTVAAPSHSFTNETGTGLYRAASHDVRLSLNGSDVTQWQATLTNFTTGRLTSGVADGASAVGFVLATTPVFSTAGTKLLSVRNQGSEKFSIDKDGAVVAASTLATTSITTTGTGNFVGIDAGSQKITHVLTPVASTDAATMGYVDARFVVAGKVTGSTGAIASQTGSLTASCVRNGTGSYTVTVAGMTSSGIVLATGMGTNLVVVSLSATSGSFSVFTNNSGPTAIDTDFSFEVVKL